MDTYIPPNIRLISPISTRLTYNRRFKSDELPTLIEQSQDLMLRSTVSFLIVRHIFGHFLVFQSSFIWHFSLPTLFLAIYAMHAGYLFSTITEPPSVECQDLIIPTEGGSVKIGVERVSVTNRHPACKA